MTSLPRSHPGARRHFPRRHARHHAALFSEGAIPANSTLAALPLSGDPARVRILIPVLDSTNALPAVRHAAREFGRGERIEIHLLHVRTPLSLEFARWLSGSDAVRSHRDTAAKVLAPVRKLLDALRIPYSVHLEEGDKAPVIVAFAGRLKLDRIVLGAARDRSLTRFVEDSVIEKVIDFAPIPVDLIVGKSVSPLERFGVPTGLGAALGLLWLRIND